MTNRPPQLQTDDNGATWEHIYITTQDGDEITVVTTLSDKQLARLEAKHGTVVMLYRGGSLDGIQG